MYEDMTYEKLLADAIAAAPPGVDTRQGSIYYDAVAGVCLKMSNFYADLSTVMNLIVITTAPAEFLDERAAEYGMQRNPATCCRYFFAFVGAAPPIGERFMAEGLYFKLWQASDGTPYLEAEQAGEIANVVPEGSQAVPLTTVKGLESATVGAMMEPGADAESDDNFRRRIREKIAGPAQNNNQQHYKTWCMEVGGVGRAWILPLWNGANTVKGILVGTDGLPAADTVVQRVQDYIDPGALGLGEGVSDIGAYFTATAAEPVNINITYKVSLRGASSLEQAIEQTQEAVTEHLKSIALTTPDGETMVVRISSIGNLIYSLPAVLDYSDLTINGHSVNIEMQIGQVAVLGTVGVT